MKIPPISKVKLTHAARILGITPKVLAARLYPPPPPTTPPEVLRIGQAARLLGVSVTSLIVWEKQGRIACLYRLPGQGRRFSRQAIEAFREGRLQVVEGMANGRYVSTRVRQRGKMPLRRPAHAK